MTGPVARLLARAPSRTPLTSVGALVVAGLLSRVFLDLLLPAAIAPDAWPSLLAGLWLRVGLHALAAGGIAAHGALIRSPNRPVLQLLPVSTEDVVTAELRRAAGGVLLLSLCAAALTLDLARRVGFWTFLLGVPIPVCAGFLGLFLGAHGFLLAVDAAEDPRWAPLLDLVRGGTPRPQAALVWALAPVVWLGGLGVGALASAAATVPPGWSPPGDGAFVGLGLALAAQVAERMVTWQPRASHRAWYRASVVLEDIRARYASIEAPQEALWVPQQHHADALGGRLGALTRLELRQGHRNARVWLSASWAVVVAAVVTVWTDDPSAPARAAAVLGLVGWASGGAVVQGAAQEPAFLRAWLGVGGGERAGARAIVVVLWSYLPVLTGAMFALRHGVGDASRVAALAGLGVGAAAAWTAAFAGRPRPWLWHGAGAALVTAGVGVLGRWWG